MPNHDGITATIRSIRNRVLKNREHINSELRTKYVMIDPILRALGWDTANPGRVRMEAHFPGTSVIPDYALFKGKEGIPVGIVEAKAINPDVILKLRERIRWHNHRVAEEFRRLQSGAFEEDQAGRTSLFEQETWMGLREANEEQLERYIREIGLTQGYAVLTNGDDWWVYDLRKHSSHNSRKLRDALERETSILFSNDSKAADALGILRYENKWTQSIYSWEEFLRDGEK